VGEPRAVDRQRDGPSRAPRCSPPAISGTSITEHGALDVLTPPAHLGSFAEVRGRAHVVQLGELSIPIAHRDDLLRETNSAPTHAAPRTTVNDRVTARDTFAAPSRTVSTSW
jgi:hypothetical protein